MSVHFNGAPKAMQIPAYTAPKAGKTALPTFGNAHPPQEQSRSGFHPFKTFRTLLERLMRTEASLPVPTQRRTRVEHEPQEEFAFHVPHYFKVVDNETGDVVSEINFQRGPVKENGLNGVQNEELLEMVAARLRGFQTSPFTSQETDEALKHVEAALAQLNARTARRETRGVEGTNRV